MALNMTHNPALLNPLPDLDHSPGFEEFSAPLQPYSGDDALSGLWQKARVEAARGTLAPLPVSGLSLLSARFSADEIDALVIAKRTLVRRRANREPLSLEETDKALRLARIASEADRIFANPEKSARWLRKPNAALSGHAPLELLKSEAGALAVDELLGQIDHGMFG